MPVAPALAAAWQWAARNPETSIPIGATIASSLKNLIAPSRQRKLQMDVLDSQTGFRDQLARNAFGNFTAAERQQIQAAAEPQVNQVAANVASRGLGGSGAGAQVIAQAQQAPIQQAQQNALQALPGANAALAQSLMHDNSFFEDLTAISKGLQFLADNKIDVDDITPTLEIVTTYLGGGTTRTDNAAGATPGSPAQKPGEGYIRPAKARGGYI